MFGEILVTLFVLGVIGQSSGEHNFEQRFAVEAFCPSGRPSGLFDQDLDLTWLYSVQDWYVHWASPTYFLQNAEVTKGSSIKDFKDLERMCLKLQWSRNSTIAGYGRTIHQQCQAVANNGNPYYACVVVKSDPGTKPEQFANYAIRVILTDNKTWAVFTRCANGVQSYYFASTTPKPSPLKVLQSSLKVMRLGFDIRNLVHLDSSYCNLHSYNYNPYHSAGGISSYSGAYSGAYSG